MTLMQLVFGAVCAGADGDIALPSLSNMPWVVLIACAGLFAHLCLTSALSLAPATVVVPVDLLRLPVIMLVGFSLYGEVIDIYVVLGALVIFGANYMNIWIETRAVKPASKGVEPTG
jgi:drug/metabolite transporter (DMT)-like permease